MSTWCYYRLVCIIKTNVTIKTFILRFFIFIVFFIYIIFLFFSVFFFELSFIFLFKTILWTFVLFASRIININIDFFLFLFCRIPWWIDINHLIYVVLLILLLFFFHVFFLIFFTWIPPVINMFIMILIFFLLILSGLCPKCIGIEWSHIICLRIFLGNNR